MLLSPMRTACLALFLLASLIAAGCGGSGALLPSAATNSQPGRRDSSTVNFQFIDLEMWTGETIEDFGLGVNNVGQVVGTASAKQQAFIYDPFDPTFGVSGFQNLGALGGGSDTSIGNAIGDINFGVRPSVKPSPFAAGVSSNRAFQWNGSTMYGLGLAGSMGQGIDAAGDVAGQDVLSGTRFAEVWLNKGYPLVPFGENSATISEATVVEPLPASATGKLVAGFELDRSGNKGKAFLYNSATASGSDDVSWISPLPGDTEIVPRGLNENALLVVGNSRNESGVEHAFVASTCTASDGKNCSSSKAVELPTLGGAEAFAEGVNSASVIVGYAQDDAGVNHAAIWRPTGKPGAYKAYDLSTEYAPKNWVLTVADGINDDEQIVGYGSINSGGLRPFLLTLNLHGIDISYPAVTPSPQAWSRLESIGPHRGLNVIGLWGGLNPNHWASKQITGAKAVGDVAGYILLSYNGVYTGTQQVEKALTPVSQQVGDLSFVAIDVEQTVWPTKTPPATPIPPNSTSAPVWRKVIADAVAAVPATLPIVIYTSRTNGWAFVKLGGSNQPPNPYVTPILCPLWDTTEDNVDDLLLSGKRAWISYGGWQSRSGKQYALSPPTPVPPAITQLQNYTGIKPAHGKNAVLDLDVFDPSITTGGCLLGKGSATRRRTQETRFYLRRRYGATTPPRRGQ